MDEETKLENEITDEENRGSGNNEPETKTTDEGGETSTRTEGKGTEPENKNDERKFTQDDVNKAVSKALAKKLPPKEEMDEFRAWKKSQQTEQERQQEREKHYADVEKENAYLKQENAVIKAGVNAGDVDYVLFKVGRMEGDFDENLEIFLKENEKYKAPETKRVEGAEHKPKSKETITKKQLNAMSYKERTEYKRNNPEAYRSAMKGN